MLGLSVSNSAVEDEAIGGSTDVCEGEEEAGNVEVVGVVVEVEVGVFVCSGTFCDGREVVTMDMVFEVFSGETGSSAFEVD